MNPYGHAAPSHAAKTPQATSHKPQATSHKPQATGHKPQATSHKPQATSHKPQATSHKPQATSHKPQATSHKPQATSHKPQARYVPTADELTVKPAWHLAPPIATFISSFPLSSFLFSVSRFSFPSPLANFSLTLRYGREQPMVQITDAHGVIRAPPRGDLSLKQQLLRRANPTRWNTFRPPS